MIIVNGSASTIVIGFPSLSSGDDGNRSLCITIERMLDGFELILVVIINLYGTDLFYHYYPLWWISFTTLRMCVGEPRCAINHLEMATRGFILPQPFTLLGFFFLLRN